MIFVDTNVFLIATDHNRPGHSLCRKDFNQAAIGTHRLVTSSQVWREYLVVATRPETANGLQLSSSQAVENIRAFQSIVDTLDDDSTTLDTLLTDVTTMELRGKRIHDANLVACMKTHGVSELWTLNPSDFKSWDQITLHPQLPNTR